MTTTAVRPNTVTENRSWRLGARGRKAYLLLHIVSGGVWIGIDVVMGLLVFTAIFSDDNGTKALIFRALEMFAVWPLFVTGLVCLVSGVVLSLGTKYGLIKYWWVTVKLLLNLLLVTLVLLALRPGVHEMAELARQSEAGQPVPLVAGDMIFPPVVSTSALLIAMTLAVFKPWGRIRR